MLSRDDESGEQEIMRYYVVADIYGYYTQMKSTIEKAGFFSDPTLHKLIMLGDIFDRGHEAKQVQQFVLEQMEQDGEVRCASKTQYLQGCHTAFADGHPSHPGRHKTVLNSITMQKALCVRILCTQRTFLDQ